MTDLAVSRPLDILPNGKTSRKNAVQQLAGWKKEDNESAVCRKVDRDGDKTSSCKRTVSLRPCQVCQSQTCENVICKRVQTYQGTWHKYASSCSFFITMPKKNTFFQAAPQHNFSWRSLLWDSRLLKTVLNARQNSFLHFRFFCAQAYGQHRARRTVQSSSAFWYVCCSPRGAFLVEQFYESP